MAHTASNKIGSSRGAGLIHMGIPCGGLDRGGTERVERSVRFSRDGLGLKMGMTDIDR